MYQAMMMLDMEDHIAPEVMVFVFLAIGAISLFTFLAVAVWSGARQAERTEYYKAEMMKKIAEVGGDRNPALEYLREQERIAAAKRLGGYKLGGLINIGVGIGLMALLHNIVPRLYAVGLIPLFVGLALFAYGFWFAPERQQ
jgi:hypothetical protein